MSIDLSQFQETFFEESCEGLDAMESGLLALELDGDNGETINTIFRAAHSIKGGSGTFGFTAIAGFTHVMETLLDDIRAGKKGLTQEIVDLLLKSVDCLRDMMMIEQYHEMHDMDRVMAVQSELERVLKEGKTEAQIAAENEEITDDEFDALLDQMYGAQGAPGKTPTQPAREFPSDAEYREILDQLSDGDRGWEIRFRPFPDLMAQGNDPLHIFRELEGLGDLAVRLDASRLPEFGALDPNELHLGWDLNLRTDADESTVHEAFAWVEGSCELELKPFGTARKGEATVAKTIEQENAGRSATPLPKTEPVAATPAATAVTPVAEKAKSPAASAAHAESASIRVAIDKIDSLINLVGELVITQSMLSQLGSQFEMKDLPKLVDGLSDLERNSRELQEAVMRVRMVPISFAFARFPRLVRDLAGSLGKKFELKMTGEQTELDKTVMEKIGDPLVHLVRNSLDHGIELPQERRKAGKPETGTLHLNAYHHGGNIVIEISDDGAGLNKEKILHKARERGLVGADEIPPDDRIYELIMQPGFSTADQVSDLSGRGVGMDVVRRNIIGLGGTVDLRSEYGKGTTVVIRLPLTLAILDGQIVRVGDETYIIPLISIIETIQIDDDRVNAVAGKAEVFKLRDAYIQIVRLYDVFQTNSSKKSLAEGLLVVVEGDGQRVGLFVDELLGQQQVVIKSLESNYEKVDGISGATILGDGSVALIIDVAGMIQIAHEAGLTDRATLMKNLSNVAATA
jgi:two-component system chemotaxis sensor kinase CheA